MRRHFVLAMLATGTALLGGCGGGGGAVQEPVAMSNEVPDSALGSATAYTAYVGTLASSETARPLDISKIADAPASETAPPAAI
jgi:hypothetical protein